MVRNARSFADALIEAGLPLFRGGTDTHMVVVDLRASYIGGRTAERRLEAHCLVCNAVPLPARAGATGHAGLRLGSTAMTIRGLDKAGFRRVAHLNARILNAPDDGADSGVRGQVTALAERCPVPAGCVG